MAGIHMGAEWSGAAFASDACLSGYAVSEAKIGEKLARECGRLRERWRFKEVPSDGPADHDDTDYPPRLDDEPGWILPSLAPLVDAGVLPPPRPAERPVRRARALTEQPCPELLPLPNSVLRPSIWKLLVRGGFLYDESIRMLEGRTSLLPLVRASRSTREFGLRLLMIGDNMGSILSFDRGRCCDWGHLLLCRRQAARTIATGLRPHWRYAESSRNPTDWDSRAVERGELQRHQTQHFSTASSSAHLFASSAEHIKPPGLADPRAPIFLELHAGVPACLGRSLSKGWLPARPSTPSTARSSTSTIRRCSLCCGDGL